MTFGFRLGISNGFRQGVQQMIMHISEEQHNGVDPQIILNLLFATWVFQ